MYETDYADQTTQVQSEPQLLLLCKQTFPKEVHKTDQHSP